MAHSSIYPRRSALRWLAAPLLVLTALPALADIEVDVQGIEGEMRRNVLTFLSVERYRRDEVDEDTMQRLFNRIDGEVKSALRPLGYYEPEVKATYTKQGNDWRVVVVVEPRRFIRVRELQISIEGEGEEDPVFESIREQTVLREGMRLHHGAYEEVKGALTRIAAANGYLAASLTDSEMRVDPTARTAGIFLRLQTGPKYHFGTVTIDQDVIRAGLMQRFVRFKEGDAYSTNLLLATQFALDDSLYFRQVDVVPGEADPATLRVPITITARKSKPQLSLGGGYGTDTKVRGTASWVDSRVNDRGHRLRIEVKASASTRSVNSRYDIPIGDPALEKFSLEGLNEYEESADVDTTETTLRPSITRMAGSWQTVSSLSFTRTTTEELGGQFTNNLLVPGLVIASVPEGFLGEALFSRGVYADLQASDTKLGAGTDFLRVLVQLERSFDLNYRWHLLLRGEVGTALVKDFSRLDGIFRFYAGGDRSVRGFSYQSLSPEESFVDDDGLTKTRKTGGRHLFTGSVELVRDIPWNLAIATFFDTGNAFNKWGDELEYSVGVGLRYRLPVLSIGVDIAKPISTGGDLRLHLNITPKL